MWVMNTITLPTRSDALLSLLQGVKEHYIAPPPRPRKPGKPPEFSSLSFLLLAVVAVVTRSFSDSELHRLLRQDDDLLQALDFCRLPHRTTIGRRLVTLLPHAEEQIQALGQVLAAEVQPGDHQSAVSAIDGRMYEAQGPKWHQKDRQAERVPSRLRNVDCQSSWSKSGYRGWIQGYRLIVQGLVFPHPVPLWAAWRSNHDYEATVAWQALAEQNLQVTDVLLGDTTFAQPDFRQAYQEAGGWVLTPKQLPRKRRSWKQDLYEYRKETQELLFQRIIQASGVKACPVKGYGRNGAFVLATVWLYQICFLKDYRAQRPLACIKEHIERARWRLKLES